VSLGTCARRGPKKVINTKIKKKTKERQKNVTRLRKNAENGNIKDTTKQDVEKM